MRPTGCIVSLAPSGALAVLSSLRWFVVTCSSRTCLTDSLYCRFSIISVCGTAKEVMITLPPATLEEHLGLLLPLLQHASPPSPMPGLKRTGSVLPAGPGNARLNALEVTNLFEACLMSVVLSDV